MLLGFDIYPFGKDLVIIRLMGMPQSKPIHLEEIFLSVVLKGTHMFVGRGRLELKSL